jgi:hypothetical protein
MVRIFSIALGLLLFVCCEEEKQTPKPVQKSIMDSIPQTPDKETILYKVGKKSDLRAAVTPLIKQLLNIGVNESFELSVYEKNLNEDGVTDAIITVNRYEHAITEAKLSNQLEKQAANGFMGHHNHFFFYDGKTDQLTNPIPIGSTPQMPLEVRFEYITSESYPDVLITHRVRNSAYQSFYRIKGKQPVQYFGFDVYNNLGNSEEKAYFLSFQKNPKFKEKVIEVYEGKAIYPDTTRFFNLAHPKIEQGTQKFYSFFYVEALKKYAMLKPKP